MTIPANDALTLAMAHNDSARRSSRSRSLTRSPSPKISFASLPQRPSVRQRKSKGSNVSHENTLAQVDEADDVFVEKVLVNGAGNGHAKEPTEDSKGTSSRPKKVDWEIPRKTLHSSIGSSCLSRAATNRLFPRTTWLILFLCLRQGF